MLKCHKVVLIDTLVTNVVVIAVSCFNELLQFGLERTYIEFGVGINKRLTQIHNLTSLLGTKIVGRLFSYDFTSCHTVSALGGKVKLSAWTTWRVFDDIMPVFEKYSHRS